MKAMILAAGEGTRLRPLTLKKPKALAELRGFPLLNIVINRLARQGFTEIIVNTNHLANQIVDFIDSYQKKSQNKHLRLAVSHEEQLLDTGGGVQKASWFFDDGEPFLVHNVDIMTDLDLNQLMLVHRKSNSLATLAVKKRSSNRQLLFNKSGRLCGWQSLAPKTTRMAKPIKGSVISLSFMGIQIMSPHLLDLIQLTPPFSLVDLYLKLTTAGHCIQNYRGDKYKWIDLGRIEHFETAAHLFNQDFFSQ